MSKYLYLLCLLFVFGELFGQKIIIEGEIIRERLLSPIPRQKISMEGVSGVHPVYSNNSGNFVLELPEKTEISYKSRFLVNDSPIDTSQYEYSKHDKFLRIKLKDNPSNKTHYQGKPFYFHVTLKDQKERPLSEKLVTIEGTQYKTNRDGKFSLTAFPLDPEIYEVNIKSENDELKKQVEELSKKEEKNEQVQSIEQIVEIAAQIAKKNPATLSQDERKFLESMKGFLQENTQNQDLLAQIERITATKDSLDNLAQERQKQIETQKAQQLELEHKSQQEREAFRKKLSWAILAVLILGIVAIIVFWYSQKIRRQKQEIEKQSKIIEEANQEILNKNKLLQQQTQRLQDANFSISEQNLLLEQQKLALQEANQEISQKNVQLENTLKELKDTQAQLVHAERMASLGNMTAGIAHEINNPINFVYSNTETLELTIQDLEELIQKYKTLTQDLAQELVKKTFKDIPPSEELIQDAKDCVHDIREGAVRTIEIVKSLNNFSRHNESSLKRADLHENIDSTLVILRNQYKDNIEIVKNYGKIPLVECFLGNINQVFMNLISNAIQAIEGKGKITISTQSLMIEQTEFVRITISDTGKGMSAEVQQRIFEPYFTTKVRGVGLGLAIVAGIIENHKGKISFSSELNKGTSFFIDLPVVAQTTQA